MAISKPSNAFRYDINALRGVAVVAVMLFHFNVPGFTGGFVGVDVFFVISGFLMTGIIVRGLEAKGDASGFSLAGFYFARAKRILPALIVLCAALLALGWFALASTDYRGLGSHSATSLLFLSNIKYWLEAGYFDAASHEKWLLHTWSLSVEWQFYLILPLMLMAVWRFFPGRRPVCVAMLAGLAASLAGSILMTPVWPSAAFYLFPARAWEMLAGGLTFLLGAQLPLNLLLRKLAEYMGYGLVAVSILGLDPTESWPGYLAMLPVSGTVLVLMANQQNSVATRFGVIQRMGTWSYSIYLWHWPVVVALTYLERQNEPVPILIGLAASVLAGWISYVLIEDPARRGLSRLPRWPAMSGLALIALAVAVPGAYIRLHDGVTTRMPPSIETVSNEAFGFDQRREDCEGWGGTQFRSCIYGGPHVAAIVIGDSHANAVVTAIEAALPRPDQGVQAFSYTSCPTLFHVKNKKPNLECAAFNEWAMRQIDTLPRHIPLIIVNRSSEYAFGSHVPQDLGFNKPTVFFSHDYKRTIPEFLGEFRNHLIDSTCRIAATRPVYMMRPIPEMPVNVPKAVARGLVMGKAKNVSITLHQYHQRHDFIWAGQDEASARCGVRILNPLPYLCANGHCDGMRNSMPLYYDDNHLSEHGNKLLVPMFRLMLDQR
jgi:peptidoglycan/LPS O-acetylase OafA/YrhL